MATMLPFFQAASACPFVDWAHDITWEMFSLNLRLLDGFDHGNVSGPATGASGLLC